MVEIFKTNIDCPEAAAKIKQLLLGQFPHYIVNFDLDDCDKILRIEAPVITNTIIQLLNSEHYTCEILEE